MRQGMIGDKFEWHHFQIPRDVNFVVNLGNELEYFCIPPFPKKPWKSPFYRNLKGVDFYGK